MSGKVEADGWSGGEVEGVRLARASTEEGPGRRGEATVFRRSRRGAEAIFQYFVIFYIEFIHLNRNVPTKPTADNEKCDGFGHPCAKAAQKERNNGLEFVGFDGLFGHCLVHVYSMQCPFYLPFASSKILKSIDITHSHTPLRLSGKSLTKRKIFNWKCCNLYGLRWVRVRMSAERIALCIHELYNWHRVVAGMLLARLSIQIALHRPALAMHPAPSAGFLIPACVFFCKFSMA